ncbi:hypothetical protein PoB_003467900 [Plakobranchus ocellatus]|uniref:Transmembrane protein n=1 Tax=Plakobranchus ocellatus TaxID=259542 RepID=A0AAV4APQ9_9GAST|nr:hypothetical protein PoB_003467900 [Plakobranchus ocellatus]
MIKLMHCKEFRFKTSLMRVLASLLCFATYRKAYLCSDLFFAPFVHTYDWETDLSGGGDDDDDDDDDDKEEEEEEQEEQDKGDSGGGAGGVEDKGAVSVCVIFGVTVAVGEYNINSSGRHLFFLAVGCALTSATICLGQKRDKTRIRKADAAHEAPAKRGRALRKQAQQPAQQDAIRAEAGPSYVPGGF